MKKYISFHQSKGITEKVISNNITKFLQKTAPVSLAYILISTLPSYSQIKIGLSAPLTGPYAEHGMHMRIGAEQAISDINAKGGINGKSVSLLIIDDASDVKQGVSAANRFVSEGIRFVVGHMNSDVSKETFQTYQESGILVVNPSSVRFDQGNNQNWNFLRVAPTEYQMSEAIGIYIGAAYSQKNPVIVGKKGDPSIDICRRTQEGALRRGVNLENIIDIGNTSNIGSDASNLLKKANVVVYCGRDPNAKDSFNKMLNNNPNQQILLSQSALHNIDFSLLNHKSNIWVALYPDVVKYNNASDAVKNFKQKGIEPSDLALRSYASIQVLTVGSTISRSTDPKIISETLKKSDFFDTVVGPIAFSKNGNVYNPNFYITKLDMSSEGFWCNTSRCLSKEIDPNPKPTSTPTDKPKEEVIKPPKEATPRPNTCKGPMCPGGTNF